MNYNALHCVLNADKIYSNGYYSFVNLMSLMVCWLVNKAGFAKDIWRQRHLTALSWIGRNRWRLNGDSFPHSLRVIKRAAERASLRVPEVLVSHRLDAARPSIAPIVCYVIERLLWAFIHVTKPQNTTRNGAGAVCTYACDGYAFPRDCLPRIPAPRGVFSWASRAAKRAKEVTFITLI